MTGYPQPDPISDQPGQPVPPQDPAAGQHYQQPPQQPGAADAQQAPPHPGQYQQAPGAQADSMDPNIAGLVAYITWIGGLIMFLTQKNREVRFHAAQCILLTIAGAIGYAVLFMLQMVTAFLGPVSLIFSGVSLLAGVGLFALWIFLVIKGYKLEHFKLPLIGDMAEKWAAGNNA